jgi:hypothetical protein
MTRSTVLRQRNARRIEKVSVTGTKPPFGGIAPQHSILHRLIALRAIPLKKDSRGVCHPLEDRSFASVRLARARGNNPSKEFKSATRARARKGVAKLTISQ